MDGTEQIRELRNVSAGIRACVKQEKAKKESERETCLALAMSMNRTGIVNFLPTFCIRIHRSSNPLLSLPFSCADVIDVGLNYFELLNNLYFPHKKEPLLAATTLAAIYISVKCI